MSMDGCAYTGLRFPFVSCFFHTRGLPSASSPLAGVKVTTAVFHRAISFQRDLHLHGFCIHAAVLDLTVGSSTYGTTLSLPVTPRKENQIGLRKQENCMQRLNSSRTDVSSDLESHILDFMHHSERPDMFPSRCELLKAGRSDLVEAILARGGWMVAGWDLEPGIQEEAQSCENFVIDGNTKSQTGIESVGGFQESQPACLGDELGIVDKNEVSQSLQTLSSSERQRAWEKVADLFGLSSSTKPEYDEKPVVLANQESPRTWPNVVNGTSALAHLGGVLPDSNRRDFVGPSLAGRSKGSSRALKAIKRKKKGGPKPSKLSNRTSSAKKGLVAETKCNNARSDDREQDKENDKSISLRIQGLESELVSFLDSMKSGRPALNDGIKLKQEKKELEEVSDALEFCETQIMNMKRELRTARAQRTAIEGKLALDLMEFKQSFEEKDRLFDRLTEVLKTLRTARIVWPNAGKEVFLAGSYDGWASWKRMEISSAGVFVTTLQLYPGRYEIKFIVDGIWITDPNRPRTWANGYENNVLTVS